MQIQSVPSLLGKDALRSVGGRIYAIVGFILVLLAILVGLTFVRVSEVNETLTQVKDLRLPTAIVSADSHVHMLTMLINIRAYLALADPIFIDQYEDAREDFLAEEEVLSELSVNWTNSANIERLAQIREIFATWELLPPQMFELRADQLANQPALRILTQEGAPRISLVANEITNMIEAQALREATKDNIEHLKEMADFRASWVTIASGIRGYLATEDMVFQDEYAVALTTNNAAWDKLLAHGQSEFTSQQQTSIATIITEREEFLPLPSQMFAVLEGEHAREDLFLFGTEAVPQANAILDLLVAMETNQESLLNTDINRSLMTLNDTTQQILILGVLMLGTGTAISTLVIRSITNPLANLTNVATSLEAGDLTSVSGIDSNDEIGILGQTLDNATGSLRHIITILSDDAIHLASTSTELAASTEELSRTAIIQSDNAKRIASSVAEIAQTTTLVANNTKTAVEATSASREQATSGAMLVNEVVTSVGQVHIALQQLTTRSTEIDTIVNLIRDIAAQTHILALNASIEAAGASEEVGLRFNVVAEEIRKLAESARNATNDIGTLIQAVQDDTHAVVVITDEITDLAQQSGQRLQEIVEASAQVNDMVELISSAAVQQSVTVNEISDAVGEIAQASVEIATATQQSSLIGVDMSNMSVRLKDAATGFKVAN
jgi:methyl-accepting chemotaxis protein